VGRVIGINTTLVQCAAEHVIKLLDARSEQPQVLSFQPLAQSELYDQQSMSRRRALKCRDRPASTWKISVVVHVTRAPVSEYRNSNAAVNLQSLL